MKTVVNNSIKAKPHRGDILVVAINKTTPRQSPIGAKYFAPMGLEKLARSLFLPIYCPDGAFPLVKAKLLTTFLIFVLVFTA